MKIERVNKSNKEQYLKYTEGKKTEFFYYILNFHRKKKKKLEFQAFMAINEFQETRGIFYIWHDQYLKMHGTKEAITSFLQYLSKLSFQLKLITTQIHHQDILEKFYPNPRKAFDRYRLVLKKGDEKISELYKPTLLKEDQKSQIASFYQQVDPEFFGDIEAADISIDENHIAFGIMEKDQLTAVVTAWKTPIAGKIDLVGTNQKFQRGGRAKSLISSALSWLLKYNNEILIQVRVANTNAIELYEKLGFRKLINNYLHYI